MQKQTIYQQLQPEVSMPLMIWLFFPTLGNCSER
jgi:hypothetical protein